MKLSRSYQNLSDYKRMCKSQDFDGPKVIDNGVFLARKRKILFSKKMQLLPRHKIL